MKLIDISFILSTGQYHPLLPTICLSTHLLKDVGRSHETEADGLHDGVRVPPAPPVVSQPRLDGFIQLNFWEATQSIAVQVRLKECLIFLNLSKG